MATRQETIDASIAVYVRDRVALDGNAVGVIRYVVAELERAGEATLIEVEKVAVDAAFEAAANAAFPPKVHGFITNGPAYPVWGFHYSDDIEGEVRSGLAVP